MIGATAGSASRFAGSPASGTRAKWSASSGAVATVAATLMAVPSTAARDAATRTGPRAPALAGPGRSASSAAVIPPRSGGASTMIPATAANESCHPDRPPPSGLRQA